MSETATTSDDEVFWTDLEGKVECDHGLALSRLLAAGDGVIFVLPTSGFIIPADEPAEPAKILIGVNCNDLFAWACADLEEVPYNEIPSLYRAWKKEGGRGACKWACKHRGERPQKPIEKRWRDAGDWDDELEALPAK